MESDGNNLFDDMYELGRNGKFRPKRACPIGTFSKKFIETLNSFDYDKYNKIHQNFNKKYYFSILLKEDARIKQKFKKLRRQKADEIRRLRQEE